MYMYIYTCIYIYIYVLGTILLLFVTSTSPFSRHLATYFPKLGPFAKASVDSSSSGALETSQLVGGFLSTHLVSTQLVVTYPVDGFKPSEKC